MGILTRRCPICAKGFDTSTTRLCPDHGLPLVEERISTGSRRGPLSGRVLDGRYLLGSLAGMGGMGSVYEAENLRIGRRVAVKVLHAELNADPKMRMRLFREVQATSRIDHVNVVDILDYGQDEQAGWYLVMEFLEGKSLADLIAAQGVLPVGLALRIASQLSSGLAATHGSGVIHRDLKPSNIRLLPDGAVKVLDFGLVKPFRTDEKGRFATITTGGIAFGTPWYMSPEQASLKPLDPRSDIYSLGIVLYEMLTGRTPFVGESPLDLIDAQRTQAAPLPRDLDPPRELPATLELLLLKMLNKDPDQRPQTMTELFNDFSSISHAEGIDLTDLRALPAVCRPAPASTPDHEQMLPTLTRYEPAWPILEERFRLIALQRLDDLCDQIVDELRAVFPHYSGLDRQRVRSGTELTLRAALDALAEPSVIALPRSLKDLADQRMAQQFSLAEVLGAFVLGLSLCRPILLDAVGHNLERFVALQEKVDRRALHLYLLLVDYYGSQFNTRLIRANELLSHQNEQLHQLRTDLAKQLRSTSRQLGRVELLKSKLVERISSGLLLIEHGSGTVLLCNKAMGRMLAMAPNDVVDRTIDEVLHVLDGVPVDEFIEQLQLHGEVGMRKLRVRLPSGIERVVYVRGEAIARDDVAPTASLFVIDDVTEREQVVDMLARYLPQNVVRRARGGSDLKVPHCNTRQAAVLSCAIDGFDQLATRLCADDMGRLLNAFVCALIDVISHHRGHLHSVHRETAIAYFSCGADLSEVPAARAAAELRQRFAAVCAELTSNEGGGLQPTLRIGLHAGELLLFDVGDEHRLVHTIAGEALQTAERLRDAAAAGEAIVSVAGRSLATGLSLATGPTIAVGGSQSRMGTFRILSDTPSGTDGPDDST